MAAGSIAADGPVRCEFEQISLKMIMYRLLKQVYDKG